MFLILKKHKFLESTYFVLMLSLPLLQLVVTSNKKAAYLFSLLSEYLHDGSDDLALVGCYCFTLVTFNWLLQLIIFD